MQTGEGVGPLGAAEPIEHGLADREALYDGRRVRNLYLEGATPLDVVVEKAFEHRALSRCHLAAGQLMRHQDAIEGLVLVEPLVGEVDLPLTLLTLTAECFPVRLTFRGKRVGRTPHTSTIIRSEGIILVAIIIARLPLAAALLLRSVALRASATASSCSRCRTCVSVLVVIPLVVVILSHLVGTIITWLGPPPTPMLLLMPLPSDFSLPLLVRFHADALRPEEIVVGASRSRPTRTHARVVRWTDVHKHLSVVGPERLCPGGLGHILILVVRQDVHTTLHFVISVRLVPLLHVYTMQRPDVLDKSRHVGPPHLNARVTIISRPGERIRAYLLEDVQRLVYLQL
mmetsp:Transcript_33869/g.83738  ORF Transcript_33869/g.83738 Transcript_33869/m.83738 type:complete len:344 (+) Transcript_33869:351-1382(+)